MDVGGSDSLLDSLGRASLRDFDAFPKVAATYKERSARGGFATIGVTLLVLALTWSEMREYLFGEPKMSFSVDRTIGHALQINVDLTMAMPCHWITIDVRDAIGDRLHMVDELTKDGTTFEIGQAHRLQSLKDTNAESASRMIRDAKGKASFPRTAHLVQDGPACRIYGAILVKKVTGNLHITTLGHGYQSYQHTEHELMNLSHVIHSLSFGPYYPRMIDPLDNTLEIAPTHFHVAQYFISVVSTRYVDRSMRAVDTNQYSVTEMSRATEHGQGVPGIFIKYDIEPMALKIEERTMLLHDFLIRLAGIVGGLIVCSSYAWRVTHGAAAMVREAIGDPSQQSDPLGNGHANYESAPPLPRQPSYDRRRQSYILG